ncbi:MAG: leucyl aminopeptidase, partial [Caldilineae bacterium]
MNISVEQGDITRFQADLIIVNLFAGVEKPAGATGAVDRALGGRIGELIALGDCKGDLGATTLLYSHGALPAPRVLVVGLGEREAFGLPAVREASARAIAAAGKAGARTVATIVHGGGAGGLDLADAAQAVVEAAILESYTMPRQSSREENGRQVESLSVVEFAAENLPAVESGARAGRIVAESVNLARDLVAHPANIATPTMIAERAREMAGAVGLDCTILEREEMEALGMGILLAVARGSDEPPKFLILEHNKERADELDTVVLVGKGVTFDTGGYTLKIANRGKLWQMKADMTGAADVIGTLRAAALLE